MNSCELPPHLVSLFDQIINHEIDNIDLLARVAEEIADPTISAIITSLIGDEIGHVQFFTMLLSQATTTP